jgi:hypothetical protein
MLNSVSRGTAYGNWSLIVTIRVVASSAENLPHTDGELEQSK